MTDTREEAYKGWTIYCRQSGRSFSAEASPPVESKLPISRFGTKTLSTREDVLAGVRQIIDLLSPSAEPAEPTHS